MIFWPSGGLGCNPTPSLRPRALSIIHPLCIDFALKKRKVMATPTVQPISSILIWNSFVGLYDSVRGNQGIEDLQTVSTARWRLVNVIVLLFSV